MRGVLFLIFMVFVIAVAEHARSQRVVFSAMTAVDHDGVSKIDSVPVHISISNTVTVDVLPAELQDGRWPISENTALFLTNSALPGYQGNTIIYAHNWPELFGSLQTVAVNETITVTSKNGYEWKYKIIEKKEVESDQTVWLQPTKTEVLTLYTCSGIFDRKRLVIRAIPLY